jgi:hypothetical protein
MVSTACSCVALAKAQPEPVKRLRGVRSSPMVAGSLSPEKGVRDTLWTIGFSGLTGATVLLMRTVAQALHGQRAPRV